MLEQATMGHLRVVVICVATAAMLLAARDARTQAHGPAATEFRDEPEDETPETHALHVAEMESWLQQLRGRFRLMSSSNPDRPGLLVDCTGVGDGPGLQCMQGKGKDTQEEERANATMQLFGMDPLALTVNYLLVNGRGVAQYSKGKIRGDTLRFLRMSSCAMPEDQRSRLISCEEKLRIRVLADGNELQFIKQTTIRLPPRRGTAGSRELRSETTTWLKRMPPDELTDADE
jgi:hypothetical protein